MEPSTASLLTALDRDGFVILPSILSPSQLSSLRSACHTATALARTGSWTHIRTLPKQFPPWPSDASHGIWGVQHLLHPSMPGRLTFAESYFNDVITRAVSGIVGCREEDELVMELYNLLVRPDEDFALQWHRDDIPATASVEEEKLRLVPRDGEVREYSHAQWNLALYEDESLIVVPGSHRRARTEEERRAAPYEEKLDGMKVVRLKEGDVVFYDNNILHKGVYRKDRERMTLHGSMGRVGRGEERARNVLQHGPGEWVDRCDFEGLEEGMRRKAEGMRRRLVEMGRGRKIEYSHPDGERFAGARTMMTIKS